MYYVALSLKNTPTGNNSAFWETPLTFLTKLEKVQRRNPPGLPNLAPKFNDIFPWSFHTLPPSFIEIHLVVFV